MTTPTWALVAFATWTLVLMMGTIGVYRWSRILTGRAAISEFRAEPVEGKDWYRRAMRAHANCIENLPVFGAIVLAIHESHAAGAAIDVIAVAIPAARVVQSLVHVCFRQTNPVVAVRFTFFLVQVVGLLCLAGAVVGRAGIPAT